MTGASDWLAEHLPKILCCDPAKVQPDATLAQLGADSIDVVELAMAAEDDLEIEIADDAFSIETTVGELAAIIEATLATKAQR